MRVGFPVIFIRDGVEHAGITVTSSAKQEQVPIGGDAISRDQLFGELRCSVAFWDCEVRGWRQADNVPYLSIELEIPPSGDFYSEVGAPDPEERKAATAAYAEQVAKLRPAAVFDVTKLSDEERATLAQGGSGPIVEVADPDFAEVEPLATSAELATEAAIDDALDAGVGRLDDEGGPASADLGPDPLETRPVG